MKDCLRIKRLLFHVLFVSSNKPMQRLYFLSLLLCIVFFACKQDDVQIPIDPPPTGDPTYDIDAKGIPQFIAADYTEIDSIFQISKFRSGIGHDYSDSFETCRSMKHYYPVAKGTPIYAPVNATINWLKQEWTGTKIQMNVEDQPAFYVELFHVELSSTFEVGDKLTAGQLLGWHASNQTSSDIAIFVRVPNSNSSEGASNKFISYFDCMPDDIFQTYQARGISNRADCIISKEARDQDPLDCDSGWNGANGAGNLENWFNLR